MEKEKTMTNNKQIPVTTFNWGPCIIKLKMEDEYKKLFLEESKNNTQDYRSNLAGILEHETGYSAKSKEKLLPILSMYLGVYDQMYEKFTGKPYQKKPEYVLSALWINHQKSGDYNPPHDHDGKLSFVIYLQIPDELSELILDEEQFTPTTTENFWNLGEVIAGCLRTYTLTKLALIL